jgi:hypothetical protein
MLTPISRRGLVASAFLAAGAADPAVPRLRSGNDRNARLRWLSVRLTLAPRLTSILNAFSSKLCSRRRRRGDEILALAYAGYVEVNDSLAHFYSRRVRGLRRADPY